jgi:hypothetical protein
MPHLGSQMEDVSCNLVLGDFKEFFRDNPHLFKIVPEYLALYTHIADSTIKYSAALPHCRLSMAKLKI